MASRASQKTRTPSEMTPQSTGAMTGYEAECWQMAETLHGSMDAAEYKPVVHSEHQANAAKLDEAIKANLKSLGFIADQEGTR